MKRKVFLVYCLSLIFVVGSLAAGGCSGKDKTQSDKEPVVKQVQLTEVNSRNIQNRTDLGSLLEAAEETQVAFEVSGRVIELFKQEGEAVEPGSVLARLDAAEYGVQQAQAQMALDNAQVTYQQALDAFKRVEILYAAGAVSKTDFDNSRDGLTLAENAKQMAERSFALVNGKDQLKSPIGGVIINKLVTKGQLVGAGTPAYRIGQIDQLKVVLPVPDYEIDLWRTGDMVTLTLYGERREGQVERINPATNKGTGTIGVEVRLANPERDWHPGQLVQVARNATGDAGIFVPVQSVINRGEKEPYVFVAVDGKAAKRSVQIGAIAGQYLEIRSGLSIGEQVVSRGADRLFDGDAIEAGGSGE